MVWSAPPPPKRKGRGRPHMTSDLASIILRVIERAPQWMRRDLEAKDAVVRTQAEEALAAMIADALEKQDRAD